MLNTDGSWAIEDTGSYVVTRLPEERATAEHSGGHQGATHSHLVFFVLCIFGIWVAAVQKRLIWGVALTGIVLVECAVLAVNRGRCPLTGLAERYTDARSANFDIYLPIWLARWNKWIFGALFGVAEVYLILRSSL